MVGFFKQLYTDGIVHGSINYIRGSFSPVDSCLMDQMEKDVTV